MIPFYAYTYMLQGASKFDSFNSYESSGLEQQYGSVNYHDMVYEYVMNNIPAFVDEGFMTSKEDYIMKLIFQLSAWYSTDGIKTDVITTWPKLCIDLIKDSDFGKYMNAAEGKNKEIIEKYKTENNSALKLVESIVDFVKENYNWNGYYSIFASQSVKDFEKKKLGNDADINLYLASLLTDAGLEAYPVILSTRDNGKIKLDYPFYDFFNYVVVLVKTGTETMLVDATEPLLPYYLIPQRCINDQGLVIKKNSTEWVSLTNNIVSLSQSTMQCKFNEGLDSVNVNYTISSSRYEAFNLREQINDKKENLDEFVTKKNLTLTGKAETKNFSDRNKPYVILFNANYPSEIIMNKIYIAPFFTEPPAVNPLKQSERKYPVDLTYAIERNYFSTITIPDGYKVEFLPENKSIEEKYFNLSYQINVDNTTNEINVQAKYSFKKAIYDAKEYGLLKYYYTELVKKLNEKIVLSKN
jgi:hypothetical protein